MAERPDGVSWDDALSDPALGDEAGGDTLVQTAGEGGAAAGAVADDPEQIRAQIEETRAGMGETIDEISERLSPETLRERASEQVEALTDQAKERVEELADQAKDRLKETVQETVQTAKDAVYASTIGKAGEVMQNVGQTVSGAAQQVGETISDAGSSAVGTVRRNPLPFALIGLGLGMLYMNRNRGRVDGYDRYERYRNSASRPYQRPYAERPGMGEGVVGRAGRAVGDFAGGAQETVSNAAGRTWDTVSGAAGQARDQVSNIAGQVADRAGDLGGQVQEGAHRVQDQYRQAVIDNPLAVGAVALAAGAAVGLMLPSTHTEDRWMGETRENLVQAAEEAARGTIEKVQQVAGEAGRAARKEAEYQGLTGS
jgi:gas vesicle protein